MLIPPPPPPPNWNGTAGVAAGAAAAAGAAVGATGGAAGAGAAGRGPAIDIGADAPPILRSAQAATSPADILARNGFAWIADGRNTEDAGAEGSAFSSPTAPCGPAK